MSESLISSILFLNKNLPSINTFSKRFISLLNNNLSYYENSIVNSITYLVVGEILFLSTLMILTMRLWTIINNNLE